MSEYEPAFGSALATPRGEDDLAAVRRAFAAASRPYLSTPVSWLAWAALLPAAALLTPVAGRLADLRGVVLLWCGAILLGGLIEGGALLAARRRSGASPLGGWAMSLQGNLSLVGAALSAVLLALGGAHFLPGLWLLLLGHSFFALGSLALPAMRQAGFLYQLGGVAALLPGVPPLVAFAVASAAGNLWIALAVGRRRYEEPASSSS
ncbi:MAG: hypothetical protein F9K16_11735 [Thermoanaerobaculia bacterium]|nr:MAG: hypothetical protein F9K16_11735 [Thermoanaerobaculia bacterium]MBZ0102756.1 hypothetical protein [Thermoanaerobaculia bacterium]